MYTPLVSRSVLELLREFARNLVASYVQQLQMLLLLTASLHWYLRSQTASILTNELVIPVPRAQDFVQGDRTGRLFGMSAGCGHEVTHL